MSNSTNPQYKLDTGLRTKPSHEPFPKFEKPFLMGYFSVSTDRDYEPTSENLRYYKPPDKFPLDLNAGLALAIKKPESAHDEGLDHLLQFICDHRDQLLKPAAAEGQPKKLAAEFVCWRGLLRLLMCTPYESRQDWCIHVTKYMGSFYLCKRDTEQEQFVRDNETEMQKNMCAWGFKFEQYCLSESPFVKHDTSEPVDECAEFSGVFRTKIHGMEILYGAEMDGIISEQRVPLEECNDLSKLKFVELKVRQGNLNTRQQQSYNRFKTRNWWCQSFLVGVEDIYVGLRTESGMVEKVDHVEVRSLPKVGANYWTPAACAHFLIQFLCTVKQIMATENCPYTTYEFYFNSKTSRVTYECLKGKTPHSFLPDWYLEQLQPKNATGICD